MDEDEIPNEFLCPITLEIMKEPMVMPDGQTYEKEAIKRALEVSHVSPMTKMPMEFSDGVINYALKSLIENYLKEHDLSEVKVGDRKKNFINKKKEKIELEEMFARYISEDKSAGLCKDSLHVCIKPKKMETTSPVCLICVVDVSGSMNINSCDNIDSMESMRLSRLGLIKHSLNTIVSTLRKDDMICVIQFSDYATIKVRPTVLVNNEIKKMVIVNINTMRVGGVTNLWSGIKLALDTSATIPIEMYNKSIMVFTDGDSNYNPPQGVYKTLKDTLKYSKDKITISTFSYGNDVGPELLIDIANLGNGSFGYCPDGTMVGTIFINYMANMLSTATPVAKVCVTQGDNVKKSMTIGPLYRGDYRNAIFKIDKALLDKTKVTVELPFEEQTFDIPVTLESSDLQSYINERVTMTSTNDGDGDDDDDDEILDSDSDSDSDSDNEDENFNIEDVDPNQMIVESDPKPEKYEEILLNQVLRNKFIITLNKIININDLGISSDSNAKGKRILKKYFVLLNGLKYKNKFIKDLIIDIEHPDPNHGQVEKAIDLKYYKTWGKSYLYSFMRYHQFEQCGNFKDQSLQYYSYEVFSIYRKMANRIFVNLPPPKQDDAVANPSPPSPRITYGNNDPVDYRSSGKGRFKYSSTADMSVAMSMPMTRSMDPNPLNVSGNTRGRSAAPIRMKKFLDRHGGCFDGQSMVLLANHESKRVKDLRKGDRLRNNAVVQCVIEQKVTTTTPLMCNIHGVLLTPYHPVALQGAWFFPVDLVEPQPVAVDSWFNLVLEDDQHKKYEIEFEGGVNAIALGHDRTENRILRHPYFGTNKVIKDLQERDAEGYARGYILIQEFNPRALQFDETGCCINYYKMESPSMTPTVLQEESSHQRTEISVLN